MSDTVERARIALQEVGVRISELEAEIGRLRADPYYSELTDKIEELEAKIEQMQDTNEHLGPWMSGAVEDPLVCEEMKADIRAWFRAGAVTLCPK